MSSAVSFVRCHYQVVFAARPASHSDTPYGCSGIWKMGYAEICKRDAKFSVVMQNLQKFAKLCHTHKILLKCENLVGSKVGLYNFQEFAKYTVHLDKVHKVCHI